MKELFENIKTTADLAEVLKQQRQQERKRLFQEVALASMTGESGIQDTSIFIEYVTSLSEAILLASEDFAKEGE